MKKKRAETTLFDLFQLQIAMFLIIVFVLYHTERVLCYAFAFARLEQMTIDT